MMHNYQIVDEKLIAEAGHTYELIKARLTEDRHNLTEKEIFFGPLILRAKNPVFLSKMAGSIGL